MGNLPYWLLRSRLGIRQSRWEILRAGVCISEADFHFANFLGADKKKTVNLPLWRATDAGKFFFPEFA